MSEDEVLNWFILILNAKLQLEKRKWILIKHIYERHRETENSCMYTTKSWERVKIQIQGSPNPTSILEIRSKQQVSDISKKNSIF